MLPWWILLKRQALRSARLWLSGACFLATTPVTGLVGMNFDCGHGDEADRLVLEARLQAGGMAVGVQIMVKQADDAMYRHKHAQKNGVSGFPRL